MANGWTPEQREKQSVLIRQWKPWEKSSGPKTTEGKRRASMSAYKGGVRPKLRALARALREQGQVLNEIT
jgi:hypothetical protein